MTGTGEAPRRWLSERAVLEELESLNDTSMALVADYRRLAVAAAEAEAEHKTRRAQRVLRAKAGGADGKRVPHNEAETVAEADEVVAKAYMTRLVTAAQADATKEALRSVRNNQDALRTAAASHRDQIAGPGWGGGGR